MPKEYKKQKGEPKGRKYRCFACRSFTYKEGKKLEIDEVILCLHCEDATLIQAC